MGGSTGGSMIGFSQIMTILAFGALFSGVIGMVILDILIIPANPQQGLKMLATDVAKTVFVSQAQISDAVNRFAEADVLEKEFLIWRIMAGSLVSLGIIWLGYKFFSFFVPSVHSDLGSKLLVVSLIVGLLWVTSLVYSISTKQGWLWPFSGWIDLIKHSEEIRAYAEERYSTKLNETII